MSNTTILKERNPATAEFVEVWRAKYERAFDFTDESEKAIFYEGVVEMARHIATAADTATLGVILSVDGVSSLRADAVRHDSKSD